MLCSLQNSIEGHSKTSIATKFQSTNRCGLSQPGLLSGLGAFTLEVNPG